MSDADMSVVLPTENVEEFMKLFASNNTDGFNVQEFEETDSYDNAHGLSLRVINFQPAFDLYDMAYGIFARERALKNVCEKFGVKRLIIHKSSVGSGEEESITYSKKNGLAYQHREDYPSPYDECLGEDETMESEAEAE